MQRTTQRHLMLFFAVASLALLLGSSFSPELFFSPETTVLQPLSSALLGALGTLAVCYYWLIPKYQQQTDAILSLPLTGVGKSAYDDAQRYLDHVHALILVLDPQGEVIYLNQYGYRLLGYPQDSLQNTNWLHLCVPSKHHPFITTALKAHRSSVSLSPMIIEHPVLTAEGQQRLIAWSCTSMSANDEQQQLLCAGRDVTENRKTQASLHKLSCAVEQSATSVMIFDRRGLIEYVNPSFTELTEFRTSEVIGRKPTFLESCDTDTRTLTQLRRALCRGDNWYGDIAYQKKSGLVFWARERISPIKDDSGLISHYVSVCEDITLERQHQAEIARLAYQDQLTQLPNRRAFLDLLKDALERCQLRQKTMTLFYVNLDHFKRINSSLGQNAGDQILCHIAKILGREICKQDLIARHSSDEFLLALHNITHEQAVIFARRINQLIRQPITLFSGRENRLLTTSIGIASFPKDSQSASRLIEFADVAMHKVKQADRNGYRFFSKKMHDELETDLQLEQDLHRAIKNDEFVLYYQPQIDLNNPQVASLEALVRWQHPDRGMIPPDMFISIAERSGLIIALGLQVIRKACSGYQMLSTLGLGHIRIAINLSALQFRDPLFPKMFEQTLHEFNVNPAQIELELTESMLMTNIDEAVDILTQLKQLGVTLAIDDFGTGHSSLSYLKLLPLDIIKVDRSFVKDIPQDQNDMEITAAVIAMAHKLNRKIVAEGVETLAQEQFLRENECEYAQGYLYSPPVAETEIVSLIHQINLQLSRNPGNCAPLVIDSLKRN